MIMKKVFSMFLVLAMMFALAACGSKDALAGTWKADLGADGVVTWTFNGKGKCTMNNEVTDQDGTYTIDGDKLLIKVELWDEEKTYTFSVKDNQLTMDDSTGLGISGTYEKQ